MPNWNLPWFPEWNKKNPTDVFGPAIVIGAAFSAVLFAALIITWGSPYQTESEQTGPAGTGMSVAKFISMKRAGDPTVEDYYTEEAYTPEAGDVLAKDVYENVQVLGDLTEDNFTRLMGAITQWVSPEQGCEYCHAGAADGNYADDDLYTKVVSRRMIQMNQWLNEEWGDHVGAAGVNCYTCHRGQNVPSDIWFRLAPLKENSAGWSAVQNFATAQTVSTSLPHDALERYLLGDEDVAVHDLEPRVAGLASDPDYRAWQHTERTYSLMNYFSNSLGVNCTFCHNSRAFYDPAQHTPQWAVAQLARLMVQDTNNEYLVPLKDTYPENRLGPKHGDAPKAACKTCHKGWNKPMNGLDVISDWPELATTGAPVYE
ncbi:MAG: photosynthetic reaction center cytochrome PufC [Pseudomonadota bacterium]